MSLATAAPIEPALGLPPGTIAGWQIPLEQPDDIVGALGALLAPDERARAQRFVFAHDRRRFVVTRASLRVLLARYVGRRPEALRFAYGAHGKPALDRGGLEFNVSHSGERALIAVARDVPLGIDVEVLRPVPDLFDIAARYFSRAEAAAIAAMAPEQRELAFFLCWTRKEAFVKARGIGLSLALDRYSVTCTPGEPARVLHVDGSTAEAARWSVVDLRPTPGYVGALAIRAEPRPFTLATLDVARAAVHPKEAGDPT